MTETEYLHERLKLLEMAFVGIVGALIHPTQTPMLQRSGMAMILQKTADAMTKLQATAQDDLTLQASKIVHDENH